MWQNIKLYLFSKDPLVIKIIENSVKVVGVQCAVFKDFDPSFIQEEETYSVFTFFDDSITNVSAIPALPYPKILLYKKTNQPIKGFDHYIKKPFLPMAIIDYLKSQIPIEEETKPVNKENDALFGSHFLQNDYDEDLSLDAILQRNSALSLQNDLQEFPQSLPSIASQNKDSAQDLDLDLELLGTKDINRILSQESTDPLAQEKQEDLENTPDELSLNDRNLNLRDSPESDFPNPTQTSTGTQSLESESHAERSQALDEPSVVSVNLNLKSLKEDQPYSKNAETILANQHLASKVAELDEKNFSHSMDLSDFDDLFNHEDKKQDIETLDLEEEQDTKDIDLSNTPYDSLKSIKETSQEFEEEAKNQENILNSSDISQVKDLLKKISSATPSSIQPENDQDDESIPSPEINTTRSLKEEVSANLDSEFGDREEVLQDDFLDFSLETTDKQPKDNKNRQNIADEYTAEFEQPFEEINQNIEELNLDESDILEALNTPTSFLPNIHKNNDHSLNCDGEEFLELLDTLPKDQLREFLKDAKIHIDLGRKIDK